MATDYSLGVFKHVLIRNYFLHELNGFIVLSPVICKRANVLFMLYVLLCFFGIVASNMS